MKTKKLVKTVLGGALLASLVGVAVSTMEAQPRIARAEGYDVQTLYEEGVKLDTEMEEEGSVLFKNSNNTLPLADGTGIDIYGYVGYNVIQGGGGSGKGKWDSKNIFEKEAFELAGFDVNDDLWKWYSDGADLKQESWVSESTGELVDGSTYNLPEIPVSLYKDAAKYAKADKNVAVVTFGRQGHEGAELPMHMNEYYIDTELERKGSYDRTYLDPTETELELLKYLKEDLGYKQIVVLINSSNVMTIGEYEQYADAVLWIGGPGEAGLVGVGNVLRGKDNSGRQISPSGRTSDTWMTDFYSMPAFYNNGGGSKYSNIGGRNSNYNQYEENIFVGYKWYETAYADGIKVTGTPKYNADGSIKEAAKEYDFKNQYDDLVAMPFGGGLSYTTFDWAVTSSDVKLEQGGTNTVTVKVTNTGNYAGKDVVQLYIHAPYNKGGIDKAEVSLCAFGKTGRLKPGESGELKLTFNTDDVASYDYKGYKATVDGTDYCGNDKWGGFVLEQGDYEIRVQSDSHTQKTDPIKVNVAKDIIYTESKDGKRVSDKVAAYNKLNDVNAGDQTGMIYMSRDSIASDWDKICNKGLNGFTAGGREDEVFASGREMGSEVKTGTSVGDAVAQGAQQHCTVVFDAPYQDGTKKYTMNYGYQASSESVGNIGKNYWGKDNNDQTYKDAVANVGKSTTSYTSDTRFVRGDKISATDAVTTDTDPKTSYGWDEVPASDERWDNWVDQGSFSDYAKLQGQDYLGSFSSMGLKGGSASDGPGEAGTGGKENNTWWCSEVVMASTWNTELIERVGKAYGKQCVRTNITSCFGPAMDTHRSPFGGRNFEYLSEDGYLAGQMCVAETAGIQSEGVGTFNKHFMLNDLDGGRSGQIDFCSEQALREIYIRAWEYSMKNEDAPMSGMMASLNRIGASWAHRGLYIGIVREEYGWMGLAISDGMDGVEYSGETKAAFSGIACLLWQHTVTDDSDSEKNDGYIFTNCDVTQIADYYGAYMLRFIAKTRLWYDTHILCDGTIFDGSDWTYLDSTNYEEMDTSNLTANDNNTTPDEDTSSGGCGGSVATVSTAAGSLAFLALAILLADKRRKSLNK